MNKSLRTFLIIKAKMTPTGNRFFPQTGNCLPVLAGKVSQCYQRNLFHYSSLWYPEKYIHLKSGSFCEAGHASSQYNKCTAIILFNGLIVCYSLKVPSIGKVNWEKISVSVPAGPASQGGLFSLIVRKVPSNCPV